MDATPAGVNHLDVDQLAAVIKNRIDKVLIIDSRSFLEFNTCHIVSAVNVCCSKIVKRRLQQGKVTVKDFLVHTCQIEADESLDIVVYDQGSADASALPADSFIYVLLNKLSEVFKSLSLLRGGFLEFQSSHPSLCEDKTRKCAPMTSLSQPCMPISNMGPTKILPFLFLGSQNDAMNKELLKSHNITYELNVSNNCPQPDFLQDHHFMRIAVNDNYSEKLLPHFPKAFQFLDKARESNACVLVHCLAGISRSPTVAIAYVMRHLHMTSDEAYRYVKSKRATISPNFNFLGQLLEYERQLEQENVLFLQQQQQGGSGNIAGGGFIGRFQFDASPPFINGFKRQCCTDMRSGLTHSRSLTLKLPLDPGFSAQLFATAASATAPSGGDLSPTSGIAKLSFTCRETTSTTTSSGEQVATTSSTAVGQCGSPIDRSTAKFTSKCLKSKLLYLSSLKEESSARSSSTSESGSPVSPTLPSPLATRDPNAQLTPTRPTSLSPVATLVSPGFPSHDFSTNTASSYRKEAADGGSTMWRSCEKRPLCDGGVGAFASDFPESLTSSLCTTASGSSMASSWDYSRSDSTSGIGSEVSVAEDAHPAATDVKPVAAGHCMMVDSENVVLRKPLPACLLSRLGPLAGEASHSSPMRDALNRDSGNPLSPSDPKCDSVGVIGPGRLDSSCVGGDPFSSWEKACRSSGSKASRDSGILSPTWSVQSSTDLASRWDRASSFDEGSCPPLDSPLPAEDKMCYTVPVSTTEDRHRFTSSTVATSPGSTPRHKYVVETTSSFVSSFETTLLGHHHHHYRHQGATKLSTTTSSASGTCGSKFFSVPRENQLTSAHHSKGMHDGAPIRKEDGLYRAQSCPGIVARFQCPSSSEGAGSAAKAAAFLTSLSCGARPPLRRLSPSSPGTRTDKFRNRYSCGSLDYSDLERIVFDSCPDFANFGRCQSSGAISGTSGGGGAGSERTGATAAPLTPTHRTFAGRSVSIIQVS